MSFFFDKMMPQTDEKVPWYNEIGGYFVAILVFTIRELVGLFANFSEPIGVLGTWIYVGVMFGVGVLAISLNLLPAYFSVKFVDRYIPRFRVYLLMIFAGVFGMLWQATLLHGDGIRGASYYETLKISASILVPMGMGLLVWMWFGWKQRRWKFEKYAAILLGLTLIIVSPLFLKSYKDFHGFVIFFALLVLGWGISETIKSKLLPGLAFLFLALSLVGVFTLSSWEIAQRYVQRYSHMQASILKLPLSKGFELQPRLNLLEDNRTFTKREIKHYREQVFSIEKKKARGKNILFIVLESTRADVWSDPKVAPKFQKWKKEGSYFPEAIAQYPATPLAYGAMFTSQPPSILAQTSAWAKTRLFDRLAPRFDHLYLSRPSNIWFNRSAITGFFVPEHRKVNKHRNINQAFRYLKTSLEKKDEGSFFAWAHIYEPHQPWVAHNSYLKKKAKKGSKQAYKSEVAYVDDKLGDFMTWFYKQPFSKDTLVVIFSDHGEGLGEKLDGTRFFGHHIQVRNMITHIPAYFSGPGVPKDKSEHAFNMQQMDVMPTMFDFMGEALPEQFLAQGESLFRLNEEPRERNLVCEAFSIRGKEFFAFIEAARKGGDPEKAKARFRKAYLKKEGKYSPKIGLEYGGEKLIMDMLLDRMWVYDLKKDNKEKKDLSKTNLDLRRALETRLEDWIGKQNYIKQELEKH